MTADGLLLALVIFWMRVANFAIGTIRMVAITRNMRWLSACLAFIEAFVFAVVIANVVNDLNNVVNLMAYCLGAAAGSYLGMVLEARFVTSYRIVNIITNENGHELAIALRERGYGVTESVGEGRDGMVTTLRSVVTNHQVPALLAYTRQLRPDVFVAIEEARSVQRGWLGTAGGPNHK